MSITLEGMTGSKYLSFSSLESWLTCGEKYRLTKVLGLDQGQAWYLYGGSAVHEATELLDKGEAATVDEAWAKAWAKQVARIDDIDKVKAGGRATKQYPNKEDAPWWTEHGPLFTQAWVDWRDARFAEGWKILEVEHAFEIELGGVPVRGFIDRIMADQHGQVHCIDLKTGSHSPASTLQLGVYTLAYEANTGVRPVIGSFFMNRKGDISGAESMARYTPELVGGWFASAKRAIEAEVFVPHASGLCRSCGVAEKCSLFTGTVFFPVTPNVTLHN